MSVDTMYSGANVINTLGSSYEVTSNSTNMFIIHVKARIWQAKLVSFSNQYLRPTLYSNFRRVFRCGLGISMEKLNLRYVFCCGLGIP
jgi:hypothetical protein